MTIILGYNNNTDWTHLEQLTYEGHVLPTAALAATSYSSSHSSRVIGSFSTIGSSKANIMQDSTLSAAVPILPPAAPNGLDQAQFEADKRAVYK